MADFASKWVRRKGSSLSGRLIVRDVGLNVSGDK